jgi:hypothetical protein
MARPPNYSQDKKRREEAARKKREEKQQRRQQRKDDPSPRQPDAPSAANDARNVSLIQTPPRTS